MRSTHEDLTSAGERKLSRPANKKWSLESFFDFVNLLGKRRLRHVQSRCRAPEVKMICESNH